MVNNIAMLNKKIHNKIFSFIRIAIGSTQGLNVEQCYLKFKLVIIKMHFASRPEESSIPSVF